MTQKQSLYIIGDGVAVMIGRSLDPQRYLVRLQEGTPRRLQLLHVEEGAGSIASWIHQVFAESRLRGNWFDLGSGNPVDKIREVIAQWREEQQHVHDGRPSYFAYVHLSCRHPSCAAAAAEYRARLKDRKQSGDFQDRRFRMNGERHRPVVPEPPETATPPIIPAIASAPASVDSEAVSEASGAAGESGLSADAEKVLAYLKLARADAKGRVNPTMVKHMPSVLQFTPDRCQAALDELDQADLLANDGTNLYVVRA